MVPTYDANGNSLNDTFRTYTWDADGNSVTIGSATLTCDALDRMVEQATGSANSEIVYGPGGGKLALMNGTSLIKAFVPVTGGATAVYTSSGLAYYRHTDHLGSSRLSSTPTNTVYSDTAYSAFGEPYASYGAIDASFTGQNQDTTAGLYDFLAREQDPNQGRWASPDPAGLAAVDPTNPQSWNRYSYVLNSPLDFVDPLGLDHCEKDGQIIGYFEDGNTNGNTTPQQACSNVGGHWVMDDTDCISGILASTGNVGIYCDAGAPLLTNFPNAGDPGPGSAPIIDWTWWSTFGSNFFSWESFGAAQIQAQDRGYYKCLKNDMLGKATAPVITHGAAVAVTQSAEHTASGLAGVWYHFTDGRFTAWGKYSTKLVPQLASKIKFGAKVLDAAGWAYFDYEGYKAIQACTEETLH